MRHVNTYTIGLGNYILDFLLSTTLGPCLKNQEELVNCNVVHQIQNFLSKWRKTRNKIQCKRKGFLCNDDDDDLSESDDPSHQKLIKFQAQSIKLFLGLIEGNTNKKILDYMRLSIQGQYMVNLLESFYLKFLKVLKLDHICLSSKKTL